MSKVLKRIGSSLVTILIVLLILLSIVISISSVTAKANDGVPDLFGYTPFSVQTNSMQPTLSKGDYIFIEKCNTETLKKGDVVTYFTIIDGQRVINTHRIVDVIKNGDMIEYQTQGDNKKTNPKPDEKLLAPGDIIGKYNGTSIPLMGAVIDYLSTQMGFFLVILLPVLLFTLYQIYNLIRIILHNHKVDTINAANEATSDEVKEAIIAEYLAKQKEEANEPSEEKTDDPAEASQDNIEETEKEETEDKND